MEQELAFTATKNTRDSCMSRKLSFSIKFLKIVPQVFQALRSIHLGYCDGIWVECPTGTWTEVHTHRGCIITRFSRGIRPIKEVNKKSAERREMSTSLVVVDVFFVKSNGDRESDTFCIRRMHRSIFSWVYSFFFLVGAEARGARHIASSVGANALATLLCELAGVFAR